jgi:hypothetical protein
VGNACAIRTVLLALVLAGCGEETSPATERRQTERGKARAAEAQLMAEASAGPELRRRLAEHVRRVNRLLVLRDRRLLSPILEDIIPQLRQSSIAAIPTNSPWMVRCNKDGLALSFGGWTSSDAITDDVADTLRSVGPEILIVLTNTPLSEQQCTSLVVTVAEAILDISQMP